MTCLFVLPAQAKYSGGTGEPNDPYQIATAADLIALGETTADYGKHFLLTADIDLDPNLPGRKVFDKAVIDFFSGVFDGNGHTISHLRIRGGSFFLSLFGHLTEGTEVKDLGMVDVNIVGSGLSSSYIGGLVGWNEGGTVTQCYSTGVVSGHSVVGGLVGDNVGTVTRCYSTAAASGDSEVGGLVGDQDGQVAYCYSAGAVSGKWSAGGLVGDTVSMMGVCVDASFWDTQTSGQVTSWGGVGKTTAEMQNVQTYQDAGWDFVGEIEDGTHEIWQMPQGGGYPVLAIFDGYTPPELRGLGTPEAPYLISNALELGAIVYHSPSAHYRLTASIDLSGIRWGTAVIPSLAGTFDGDGHTILHLTIKTIEFESYGGLFGYLRSGAEVKNLGVVDVNITGSGFLNCVGGVVGSNGSWGTSGGNVTRCYSTGVVRTTGGWGRVVGGLVGVNYGNVIYCYSTAAVSGDGGLVGYNAGTVTKCYSAGAVSGIGPSTGGLVGRNGGGVTDCFWDIDTSGQATSAGGLGKTTSEMQTAKTFLDAGWDFVDETANGSEDIWKIVEGVGYPRLSWEKYSGGTGEPNDPYQISTAADLIALGETPEDYAKHFILTADIDLDPNLPGRKVFDRAAIAPDVNDLQYNFQGTAFTGTFDGGGHAIRNLTIADPNHDCLGLFGMIAAGGRVGNLALEDAEISGGYRSINVGTLAGYNAGALADCSATGIAIGCGNVRELAGSNSGAITNCRADVQVSWLCE
jgi:hypothetical protein